MTTFELGTNLEWAQDQNNIKKLARLIKQGVSEQDCALIFNTTVDAIVVVSQENPLIRQSLVDALDKTRYDIKRRAVSRANSVIDTMDQIMSDGDAADRDRIAAGKVILEVAGVTGANSGSSEKRMARDIEEAGSADTRSQDTLNRLINHFIDARQAEIQ